MAKVRMYVQKGCPHCDNARNYFNGRGIQVEAVEIGFDPIIQAGIRSLTGGGGFNIPLTISLVTEEIIAGDDLANLARVADALVGPAASAPNPASA